MRQSHVLRRDSCTVFVAALALAALLAVASATLAVPANGAGHTRSGAGAWTPPYPVLAAQILHLAGTQIYCNVNAGPALVDCFPKASPSAGSRNGYLIEASDKRVSVEPTTSNKPTFSKPLILPKGTATYGSGQISIGNSRITTVVVHKGYIAGIAFSHMTLTVQTFAGSGGPMLLVSYFDKQRHSVIPSYEIGISARYVTVYKVGKAAKEPVVYWHALR